MTVPPEVVPGGRPGLVPMGLVATGLAGEPVPPAVTTLSGDVLERARAEDPDVGLRAVDELRALADRLEQIQVDRARALGWSWQEIANRLGVKKQTVHRKHAARANALKMLKASR